VAQTYREIERKYDADEGLVLPELGAVPGVSAVGDPLEQHLVATYFDTTDLRLAAARTTVRRRTGGEDAGWHIKLPLAGGDRQEVRSPLGRAVKTVPSALLGPVRAIVRDRRLVPVARVSTTRFAHRLLDSSGAVLIEVSDDHVTAQALHPEGPVLGWREIEVELVDADPADGGRELLALVGDLIEGAGAQPAAGPSKLARVLGDRVPAVPAALEGTLSTKAPAGTVLGLHLREQARALQVQDPRVRRDESDSVHKMRVATRRLRSALATYRPLLDRAVTDPIRAELAWLAGVLGAARDAEVMHDRLVGVIRKEPAELVRGPVAARVDEELTTRYRSAHDAVLAELDGKRYFRLLDALDALAADPPFTDLASGNAAEVLPARVAKVWKTLRRHAQAAEDAPTTEEREHLLHDVRKTAKRARYAGESLTPAFGAPAEAFAKGVTELQEVLGAHQDSVVTRALLMELTAAAHAAGEDTFTYGRLHAMEQARAHDAEQAYAKSFKAASDKKLRRWLR
jgi:CHAD domain-containing protein